MIERRELFIGGEWVPPAGTGRTSVINPSDETVLGTIPEAVPADIDAAVAVAKASFDGGDWRRTPVEERIAVVRRFGELLQKRADELVSLVVSEMGAPVSGTGAANQVLAVPFMVEVFAGFAETFPWISDRPAPGRATSSLVIHEPLGVVGAIIPWNGPLFLAAVKVIPALLAGCSVVLKPAPETPFSAYVFAEVAEECGLPRGVLSVVPGGREVGERLVEHPDVDMVTFTGSTAAGRRIGAACGGQLKRFALELGGKSAAIVLDDADLDVTIPGVIAGGLGNNGQQCIALSRVLVSRRRYDEVVDALTEAFASVKIGHALDPETELGPLITATHRSRVEGYIETGRSEGARVTTGGGRPAGLDRGWYLEPTLFADVDNRSTIAQEEIFGPVVSVIAFDDEDDAIRQANDSPYGLSGAVFTAEVDHGIAVGRAVRTGMFNVNHFGGNLAAPFGGAKASGIGREFGPEGIEAFTELKTVSLPGA